MINLASNNWPMLHLTKKDAMDCASVALLCLDKLNLAYPSININNININIVHGKDIVMRV